MSEHTKNEWTIDFKFLTKIYDELEGDAVGVGLEAIEEIILVYKKSVGLSDIDDVPGWMEKMKEYFKAIANPLPFLQEKAEKEGNELNGQVFNLIENPYYYQSMAREALTLFPKTKEIK